MKKDILLICLSTCIGLVIGILLMSWRGLFVEKKSIQQTVQTPMLMKTQRFSSPDQLFLSESLAAHQSLYNLAFDAKQSSNPVIKKMASDAFMKEAAAITEIKVLFKQLYGIEI